MSSVPTLTAATTIRSAVHTAPVQATCLAGTSTPGCWRRVRSHGPADDESRDPGRTSLLVGAGSRLSACVGAPPVTAVRGPQAVAVLAGSTLSA